MNSARNFAAASALVSGLVVWAAVADTGVAAAGGQARTSPAAAPRVMAADAATGSRVGVSLGDSFISGEAGRWWGNGDLAALAFCTRGGTDRAAYRSGLRCRYDPKRVYGDTAVNGPNTGCHRSDVAEIKSVSSIGLTPVNLACSGAETKHIIDTGYKENPKAQSEMLRDLLPAHDVKLIVLSIGGNDLDLSGILTRCTDSYISGDRATSCSATGVKNQVLKKLPAVADNVKKAIDKIKNVMRAQPTGYKFILQSYPSPVPTSSQVRGIYPEGNGGKTAKRTFAGGCPMWNADFDLMHDTVAPKLDEMLRMVAREKGIQFLSMLHAIDGHAMCQAGTRQAGPTDNAADLGSVMEWVRYGTTGGSYPLQESFHPNAFAQQSQGKCLIAAYNNGAASCHPQPLAR